MTRVHKLIPTVGLAAALAVSISAYSVSSQAAGKGYEPPKTSFGHPSLEGVWDFRSLTPLERPKSLGNQSVFTVDEQAAFQIKAIAATDVDKLREATEADQAKASQDVEGAYNNFWMDYGTEMNEDRRTSLITDPPNGRLPALTKDAIARMGKNHLRVSPVRDIVSIGLTKFRPEGPEQTGLSERCLLSFNAGPPLTPSAYNNNLRIVQTPKHVVIFTEMIHDARVIPIDGRPNLPAELKKWTGASRGHWDGNTLVVKTANFTGKTPTFQLPINLTDQNMNGVVGTGENMTLIERFTPVSKSRLVYEYTLNDPTTFTQPFTVAIPLKATEDQMFEYACHEGNHGLAGMLKGARQEEKEEAAAL